MRTHVNFRSTAFNTTEPRPYFINECCFGDDLCRWLIRRLRERGIETDDEPGQEDFGWYFTFVVAGSRSCFVAGFQPNDPATGERWLGWVERHVGFFGSLIGGRNRRVDPRAIAAIDDVLRGAAEITDVTWQEAVMGPAVQ